MNSLFFQIAAETADKQILLETLKSLSETDLLKFKWLLELTCFQRGVPQIPHSKLMDRHSTAGIVNLMVEEIGQQCVEVTKEAFMDMNRSDLVQKLSETSSASKGKLCGKLMWKSWYSELHLYNFLFLNDIKFSEDTDGPKKLNHSVFVCM